MKSRFFPCSRLVHTAVRGPILRGRALACALATALVLWGSPGIAEPAATAWRVGDRGEEGTRFVLDLSEQVSFELFTLADPDRVVIDLQQIGWQIDPRLNLGGGLVSNARYGLMRPGQTRIVLDLASPAKVMAAYLLQPRDGFKWRLVVDLAVTSRTAFNANARAPGSPAGAPAASLAAGPAQAAAAVAAARAPAVPPPVTYAPISNTPIPDPPPKPVASQKPVLAPVPAPAAPARIAPAPPQNPFVSGRPAPAPAVPVQLAPVQQVQAPPPPITLAPPIGTSAAVAPATISNTPIPDPPVLQAAAVPTAVTRPREPGRPVSVIVPIQPPPSAAPAPKAVPAPSSGDRRPLIAIDPGHGGVDPGTISLSGVYEKQVNLALAQELEKMIEGSGRYRVMLTRRDDTFIRLRERVALARAAGAQLFISLHADAIGDREVSGLSVYTLSETASDREAEALATKENKADVIAGMDLSTESKEVSNILIDLAQRETKNLSARFAGGLVRELHDDVRNVNKAHRFAGFAVLTAPDIPSVLVEQGYLSNREDEKRLLSPTHRRALAGGILRALDAFFGGQVAGQARARRS